MKQILQIAGVLVLAGVNVQADSDARPADVTIYVNGDAGSPSGTVDAAAREAVTRMYGRIGVRLAWRDGTIGRGATGGIPVIQVRFTRDSPRTASSGALAFTLPFGDGVAAITVMYRQIQIVAGRPSCEESILAQVLAHEIGHVLQRTNHHAQTGVMKANLTERDYQAIQKKPFEFTPDDVDLIVLGLTTLKSRAAKEYSRP